MRKILLTILVVAMLAMSHQAQQSTSFSYQGRLTGNSVPATGTYDFVFGLFSEISGGASIASVSRNGINVNSGIFGVQLDFGAAAFDGGDRYLEISVKLPADSNYTVLGPRQKLASVPYATRAISAENAQNAASLGGVPASEFLQKTGDGSQLTNLNGSQLAPSSISIAQLSPDALPNNYNLKLLASGRWDLLKVQKSFPAGSTPNSITFDGIHLWVTNFDTQSVSKILASTGALFQTIPVGRAVDALAFDGQNIWVTNPSNNSVTKIRASDGVILGYFPTGVAGAIPGAIAFDGESIWFTDTGNIRVLRKNIATGVTTATIPVSGNPAAITFDGAHIWVTDATNSLVWKIRAAEATVVGSFGFGGGGFAGFGIVFDGTNLWVAASGPARILKVRPSDGIVLGTFPINGFTLPIDIAFDGQFIWVSDPVANSVARVRPLDGAVVGIFSVGTNPSGLAFDGANVWSANFSSSNVTRLIPAFPEP